MTTWQEARVDVSLIEHWSGDGLRIVTGQSMFRPHPWSLFVTGDWGIGLPRHGAYRRRARGREQIVDTNTGFFLRLDEEVEVAHFTGRTDEITFVDIDPDAHDCLPDLATASGPIRITPDITLTHRRLLRALRHRSVPLAIETIVVDLITAGLAQHRPSARTRTRLTTQSERQRLVNEACEILHTSDHRVSLVALARAVGYSPFHLCRVFRDVTGVTISQYQVRLRVNEVLERLAAGEDDLSSLAAAVGFADHSHMTRTVSAVLGAAPSSLREQLRTDR